jgi:hypothetical protein
MTNTGVLKGIPFGEGAVVAGGRHRDRRHPGGRIVVTASLARGAPATGPGSRVILVTGRTVGGVRDVIPTS